jgi:hypothetical protein
VHQNQKLTATWERGRSLLEYTCKEIAEASSTIACNKAKQAACSSLYHYNLVSKFECISTAPEKASDIIGKFIENSSLHNDVGLKLEQELSQGCPKTE